MNKGIEKVLNNLQCALSTDRHIPCAPIQLECGDTACKKCIISNENKVIRCIKCDREIKIKSSATFNESKLINDTIENFLDSLYELVCSRLADSVLKLKGK